MKKKIVFVTGTRADYGKIKSLLKIVEESKDFELYIYVTGMHLISKLGSTYVEIFKQNYKNTYISKIVMKENNDIFNLTQIMMDFENYIDDIKPDLIMVHGDRIEPLAASLVATFNNIKIAHIEGGEISGTIDEHLRHAITKLAHFHFVSNEQCKRRIIQLGELEENIYVIGSPDLDIMLSNNLPKIESVKEKYQINFKKYAILLYHPVITEIKYLQKNIETVINALQNSNLNFVIIYPNNDLGSDIIIDCYKKNKSKKFKMIPSVNFEMFLTLMKNAEFMIGNSSAGIRETEVYGIPTINIGSRQNDRYNLKKQKNLICVEEDYIEIKNAINKYSDYRKKSFNFGKGDSSKQFINIISNEKFWAKNFQKKLNVLDRSIKEIIN